MRKELSVINNMDGNKYERKKTPPYMIDIALSLILTYS